MRARAGEVKVNNLVLVKIRLPHSPGFISAAAGGRGARVTVRLDTLPADGFSREERQIVKDISVEILNI